MRAWLLCSALGSLLLFTNSGAAIAANNVAAPSKGTTNGATLPMVAGYALTEGVGITANDASPWGNTGAISGATWSGDGKFGNALSFNGFGNWVTINDATALDLSNGMTLQAWIRPTLVTGSWATVLLKEAPPGYHLAYHLELDPRGHPSTYITTDSSGLQGLIGPQPITLSAWTHLAATYDGALLSLYVNGELVASRPASGNIIPSYGPLRFGGNSIWGEYFVGAIDELRVYNRPLSGAELQTDMNTPIVGPTVTPTPSPSGSPSPTPPLPVQPLNLSTRLRVDLGNNVLIGGFILSGTEPKNVAIRGIGPSLAQSGIPDPLGDPNLELHDAGGTMLMQDDNWQDSPEQAALLTELGLALTDPNESALITLLQPGAYTAILAGRNSGSGVGLVEIYDANPSPNSQLANISTRGFVLTDNSVMIGGFILGGTNGNTHIAIRGIGPTLGQIGLNPVLADPTLDLHDANGTVLVRNDNWQDDPVGAAELVAAGLAPQDPFESAIMTILPPGLYTGVLAGKEGGTGIGLVEIYNLQ